MAFDFNKIKNLFVETSDETKSQTTEQLEVKKDVNSAPQPEKTNSTSSITHNAEIDTVVLDSLLKSIQEHNMPGEDYLEFMEALNAMQNIQLPEDMKIQTVMATLSTKGLNAQKIKESADYYLSVLSNEQKQFSTEFKAQLDKSVSSKQNEILSLQEAIKVKSEQIAKLTQEINETQNKIGSFEQNIKTAEEKLRKTEGNFNKTYEFVVNQIMQNVAKIK
ncbi:MAG: hypothetical protein IPO21_03625 [Bacteroidales bacterium]|nr:hypothetical protein [Bacteroidales bacterium]